MAAKLVILVAALCLLQGALCRVSRATDAKAENNLEQLANEAKSVVENLSLQFGEATGIKNSDDFFNAVKNGTNSFTTSISGVVAQLEAEAKTHSGAWDSIVKSATETITNTINDLKAKAPEATAEGKKLEENLQSGLETVVAEAKKIAKALSENSGGIQADFVNLTKSLLDQATKTAQEVNEKVKTAIEEKNKAA